VSSIVTRRTVAGHAAEYLKSQGIQILDRDWAHAHGVLPVVAADRSELVLPVIITRTAGSFKLDEVTTRRIRRLGVEWMQAHGKRFDKIRVDVISVMFEGTGGYTIEHIKGVG